MMQHCAHETKILVQQRRRNGRKWAPALMLARLQRIITLGAMLGTALWAAWFWTAGHPVWAIAGVLLLLSGHALILAFEFALLHHINLDDTARTGTPRATTAQLFRAWWGESRYTPQVFCWRQPFRSQAYPDHLGVAGGTTLVGHRGVVLVHGFFCNRGIWNLWLKRLHAQGVPVVAVNLEPVFGSIDHYAETIEQAVRQIETATGLAPVLVGHSMGGLALRHWWADAADDTRVHHAITLGTPHRGTWLARFAFSNNGRQMHLASDWHRQLVTRETPRRAARFTCFYSHCDNIVFPASTATLPGADNRHLLAVAHVHMVERPEPYDELLHWLELESAERG